MNSLFINLLVVITIPLLWSHSFGQEIGEKYEREVNIKKKEFPKSALELIEPILKEGKRTRFFKEYGKDSYFFEVKTIFKNEKLSIKFYKDGSLLDIEILKKFEDLPNIIQERIEQYFQSNYKKYQFNRIQIQYNREEEYEDGQLEKDDDEEYIEEFLEMDLDDLIIKYEIEAEVVNKKNDRGFFEFLFNTKGEIEQIEQIIKRADDNVLY